MYYFYYIPDFNVLDFLLCSYFINFHHRRFNSLNRVKFKRRLIRSNEARRPQTTYNFILVIQRTDLLSQGIIRCLLFFKLFIYKCSVAKWSETGCAVRTDRVPLRLLFCSQYIQLFRRERLSEKMCRRQSRNVIWDKYINTLFLTLSLSNLPLLLSFNTRKHTSLTSCVFLSNSFK